jgi:hypothetical protein
MEQVSGFRGKVLNTFNEYMHEFPAIVETDTGIDEERRA